MADLKSIAELAWASIFPRPNDEEAVDREDFVATAKSIFAFEQWKKIKEDRREYGEVEIPSYLLSEAQLPVENDEMDISSLNILRGLDQELWLQNIGGMNCECRYIKSTLNLSQTLCDDDSLPDDAKTFYPQGKKIKFPKGAHTSPLPIIYANKGELVDDKIEIDDAIAAVVRVRLIEIYAGKIGVEDKENDSSSVITR